MRCVGLFIWFILIALTQARTRQISTYARETYVRVRAQLMIRAFNASILIEGNTRVTIFNRVFIRTCDSFFYAYGLLFRQ